MTAKLLLLFVTTALLAGCGKEKYQTKPQIKIKSVKVGNITDGLGNTGKVVEFDLTVTDKEGDVQDTIIIDKLDAASPACPGNTLLGDAYKIPDFPGEPNQQVTIKVKYSNINIAVYWAALPAHHKPMYQDSVSLFLTKQKTEILLQPTQLHSASSIFAR
jgi:hypothetical protein